MPCPRRLAAREWYERTRSSARRPRSAAAELLLSGPQTSSSALPGRPALDHRAASRGHAGTLALTRSSAGELSRVPPGAREATNIMADAGRGMHRPPTCQAASMDDAGPLRLPRRAGCGRAAQAQRRRPRRQPRQPRRRGCALARRAPLTLTRRRMTAKAPRASSRRRGATEGAEAAHEQERRGEAPTVGTRSGQLVLGPGAGLRGLAGPAAVQCRRAACRGSRQGVGSLPRRPVCERPFARILGSGRGVPVARVCGGCGCGRPLRHCQNCATMLQHACRRTSRSDGRRGACGSQRGSRLRPAYRLRTTPLGTSCWSAARQAR